MIRKAVLLKMIATLVIPAAWCMAQPVEAPPPGGPEGPGPRFGPGHAPPPGPREGPKMILNVFDRISQKLPEQLNMTPDQKEKFAAMSQKHRVEMEALVKQLTQAWESYQKDLQTLLTPAQQEKLKELKAQRQRFRLGTQPGPAAEKPERHGPGIGGPARGERFRKAIDQLNLTPEKKEQVEKIMKENREKMQAVTPGDFQARRQIMQDMRQKIREVLSPEEMAKLQSILREGRPAGFGGWHRGPGQGHRGGRGPGGPQGETAPPPPAQEDSL